jgi:hypothetical protein
MRISHRNRRRRGEGHVEYVIIAMVIMTCSVATFLVAGAGSLKRVAKAKQLCVIEKGGDCDQVKPGDAADALPVPSEDGASAAEAGKGGEKGKKGTTGESQGPNGATSGEGQNLTEGDPSATGNDPLDDAFAGLGPLATPPPPPAFDPFGFGSLALSFMNTSTGKAFASAFSGIVGWFT